LSAEPVKHLYHRTVDHWRSTQIILAVFRIGVIGEIFIE
jgi:hypothetical protein